MLSREDNELVCRTGPDTPMGTLFRRYWHPFLLSSELPEPDGPQVRVKLLGEELVAFRDTTAEVGLLEERCPHRGASPYYGINDQCGLMCVYHGFAFDIHGRCIATPSDAPGSTFKDKVRAKAYPVIESAGVLWAYLGPPEQQPPFPGFIFHKLPPDHVMATRVPVYCNWLQSVEGNAGNQHVRINCHVLPEFTFIAFQGRGGTVLNAVPVDDDNAMRFAIQYNPDRPFTADERQSISARNMLMDPTDPTRRLKRLDNDYLIDRVAQKKTCMAGIWPIPEQDYAMTESMDAIVDRTREHLYPADAAIIRLRQMLIRAARHVEAGREPPGLDPSIPFEKIRSEEIIIGPADDPWQVAAEAGETAQRGERLLV